jgi:hypothetical protein
MPTNDITGVPDDWQSQFMNWLRAGGGAQPGAPPRSSVTNPLAAAASIPTTGVPPAQATAPPGLWHAGGTPTGPIIPAPGQQPGYAGSTGVGGGDPRAIDAAMNQITGMAPGVVNPGYRPPVVNPAATATAPPAAPRSVAPTPVVTPGAPNLGYYPPNPRFGTMQSQVPSGRGPLGNNPIYTTMNLFGGGQQPAAAPPAAAPGAQGATVPRTYPGEGWDIDAQGNPIPSYGPTSTAPGRMQMNPTALAGAVSQPNWWQNLGRPNMNPNQLANAVSKPNWWQNV